MRLPGFGCEAMNCGPPRSALRFQLLEEPRHLDRVVAGFRHHARAEHVGLRFRISGVLQQHGICAEPDTELR